MQLLLLPCCCWGQCLTLRLLWLLLAFLLLRLLGRLLCFVVLLLRLLLLFLGLLGGRSGSCLFFLFQQLLAGC